MGFTALIDVAIGLTLLYLGAALFVTVANEYIAQVFNMRANHLKESLAKLLYDDAIRQKMASSASFKALLPYLAQRVFGWLLTALAISIGAPFWFDVLNRLVNVRHGTRRPEPRKSE